MAERKPLVDVSGELQELPSGDTISGAVMDSDFSANGLMMRTGSGSYTTLLCNLTAAVAPTVDEDSGDGYAVGSRWIDTTADKEYVCLDATVGAAVWIETTQSGGGGSNTITDDVTEIAYEWSISNGIVSLQEVV